MYRLPIARVIERLAERTFDRPTINAEIADAGYTLSTRSKLSGYTLIVGPWGFGVLGSRALVLTHEGAANDSEGSATTPAIDGEG